jgi:hypothetical protein
MPPEADDRTLKAAFAGRPSKVPFLPKGAVLLPLGRVIDEVRT